MQKHILYGIFGILIGLIGGFALANYLNRQIVAQPNPAQSQTEAPFLNQQIPVTTVKEQNGPVMPDVTETLEKAGNEPNNFDAQIKAGEMYLKIRGFEKAEEFFDRAAALKPAEYEKIVRLGNAYLDVRKYEKAESFYLQAIEQKRDDLNVRTDLGITFVERPSPDYDRAIKEFETALQINPKHEPTLYNLAIAFYKKGDAETAQKFLSRLEQANPQSPLVGKLKQAILK